MMKWANLTVSQQMTWFPRSRKWTFNQIINELKSYEGLDENELKFRFVAMLERLKILLSHYSSPSDMRQFEKIVSETGFDGQNEKELKLQINRVEAFVSGIVQVHSRFSDCVSITVCGLSIGLLTGLSYSPVVGTVIATLVALAAATVGFVNATNPKPIETSTVRHTSIGAIALLFLGTACGAELGIILRGWNEWRFPTAKTESANVFDPNQAKYHILQVPGIGLESIAKPVAPAPQSSNAKPIGRGGLFSADQSLVTEYMNFLEANGPNRDVVLASADLLARACAETELSRDESDSLVAFFKHAAKAGKSVNGQQPSFQEVKDSLKKKTEELNLK